jgi:hypothetical protein
VFGFDVSLRKFLGIFRLSHSVHRKVRAAEKNLVSMER